MVATTTTTTEDERQSLATVTRWRRLTNWTLTCLHPIDIRLWGVAGPDTQDPWSYRPLSTTSPSSSAPTLAWMV